MTSAVSGSVAPAVDTPDRSLSRDARLTITGGLLYLLGAGAQYIGPGYLGAVATQMNLRPQALGLLSATESIGVTASCFLASFFLPRIGRKTMLAFIGVILAGSVLSAVADTYQQLLGIRFFTGLLGEGPCFAASFVVLGLTRNPDRAIGAAITLVVISASATFACSHFLLATFGSAGFMAPFVLAALLLAPACRWLPSLDKSRHTGALVPRASAGGGAMIALAGMAIWAAGPALFWAFASVSAKSRGLPDEEIAVVLSVSNMIAFVGSLIPWFLGDRIGRLLPIMLGTIGLITSAVFYQMGRELADTLIALTAFNICWNIVTVYEVAVLTNLDRTGRVSGLAAVGQLIGAAAGPALGGPLIARLGYNAVAAGVASLCITGVCLFAAAGLLARQQVLAAMALKAPSLLNADPAIKMS